VFVLPSTDKQNNNKANFNKDNSFNNVEKQCPQLASDVEQNVTTNNDGQPVPSLAWPSSQSIVKIV